MRILGISCWYHDSAAALIDNGYIVAAAQEERFTGKKHDSSFPINAIKFCLSKAKISAADLDYVVFYEKPSLKLERILSSIAKFFPKSWRLFNEFAISWLGEKLWIRARITKELGITSKKILFVPHHLSHAASSFFCSPFEEAAFLTIDGVGEWATTTYGIGYSSFKDGSQNELKILKEIHFPNSLGLLYSAFSAFTAFLGFKVNNGEYKVMGLSPYGKPTYSDMIKEKLIKINSDGSFKINTRYFKYPYTPDATFGKEFVELFGPPGPPKSWKEFDQRFADIAASIQKVTEEVMIKLANKVYQETGQKNLVMAGGVALNSVANYKVLCETPFENIYIQPAAGDAGGALGAALYVYHVLLKRKRKLILEHPNLGAEYSEKDIEIFLETHNITYEKLSKRDVACAVAEDIKKGKIVGWFHGRFEWGPRALGHRSILCDPRSERMKHILNAKIKFREEFRPFAPSAILNEACTLFSLPANYVEHYPLRFMLYVVNVIKPKLLGAVTHVNGTARPQLVEKSNNEVYYNIIENFYEFVDVPAIVNTSFNLKGEPIVNSPDQAFSTFSRSGMDVLYLERFKVTKSIN